MDVRKIDLHMHTTVSDGTDTPEEILSRVKSAGITLFSVTDHDAIKGCSAVLGRLASGDPAFICGAEFSCKDEEGKYHILGYGYDPQAPTIQNLTKTCHQIRITRVRSRLDWLAKEYNFTFSEEDIAALFALPNPGKPHVAKLMVRYGYVPTAQAAFDLYLNQYGGKVERLRPETAIGAILDAGGIPILAHPSFGSGTELIVGEEMERRLARLTEYGIKGIEAFYSGFSPAMRDELLTLAKRRRLYVTAGSDYHGTNKTVVLGDTGLPDPAAYPEGLLRFLEDVRHT